jgi:hypothetical protein
MSTEKVVRYTAEQMRAEANFAEMRGDGSITSEMLRQAARTEADVAGLVEVLKALMRGYVNTLENARDRIIELGGKCDELDDMEAHDVHLNKAKAALARFQP